MSGVETKTKQRVTLQESDLGNINPDGVNHQNVAVAPSNVVENCVSARGTFQPLRGSGWRFGQM